MTTQPIVRILGITLGAGRAEERIAAAWRAFWSQKKWVPSWSLPLRLRWTGWEQRLAIVLVFGAWPWTWSQKKVQRISTETHCMFRLLPHLRRNPEDYCVEWHVSSMRRSRDWAQLAPETFLGRGIAWHSNRCSADTAAVCRAVHVPRHIASRHKRGRPARRCKQLFEARGLECLCLCLCVLRAVNRPRKERTDDTRSRHHRLLCWGPRQVCGDCCRTSPLAGATARPG